MAKQKWVSLAIGLVALGAGAFAAAPGSTTQAQGRLSANIYLTQAQIPRNLNERAMLGFVRRNRAAHLQEVTDQPIPERSWVANLVVAFNRELGDLEFHVLFYDVHDGARRFVQDMPTFVNDRQQRTFVQPLRLERPQFRPNRDMELVVTVRRNEVGRLRFGLRGEAVQHSGEVDFTEDEVN